MKNSINSIAFKMMMVISLCAGFVLQPALRTSSANAAYPAFDLKSEAQVKSEANLYQAALREIAGLAQMKLADQAELKKALAILERQQPNLRFNRSKLIALGLADSTFIAAIKKKSPDTRAAEALLTEISADPKAVLKLDGAEALMARLQKSSQADAAILRQTAERLKLASANVKQARFGPVAPNFERTEELRLLPVNYTVGADLNESIAQIDPASIAVILVAVVFYTEVAVFGFLILKNQSTEQGRDKVAECQDTVDDRWRRCVNAARNQPFPTNLAEEANCDSAWLVASGECLVNP